MVYVLFLLIPSPSPTSSLSLTLSLSLSLLLSSFNPSRFAVNRGQALLAAKSAALETAKRDQRDLRVQAEILEQAVLTMRHVVGALITQATQKDAVAAAQLARKRAIEKEDIVQKTRTKAVIEITDTILKETTGGVSNLIGTGDGAMVSSPRSRRRSVIHGGNTESSSSMSMMTPRRGSTISGSTTSSGSSRSSSSQGTRAQLSFGSEPGTTSTSSPRPSVIKPPVESMFWVPHKQRIKEYVKAAISAALEAYEAKCREEDVEIERKQRASMFKGLGTSDKVPKFLHAVGPIRNLGFTSAHANLITKEVWALKSIRDHHLAKNGMCLYFVYLSLYTPFCVRDHRCRQQFYTYLNHFLSPTFLALDFPNLAFATPFRASPHHPSSVLPHLPC